MSLMLAFLPFIGFAVVDRAIGGPYGLFVGAALAGALLARDALSPGRSPKLLEACAFALFLGLGLRDAALGETRSLVGTRLLVDGGMLAIVGLSLALRRPFTLQYACERAPRALWNDAAFLRMNYRISAAWGGAFAALVAADLIWLLRPDLPPGIGLALTGAGLYAAFRFTQAEMRQRALAVAGKR